MVGNGAQRRHMLDRLVRRAVLAEADRIMRHHEADPEAHQRGEPHRRPGIVGEHQEGAAIGDHAAMERHAVHGRRHAVLANAVMHVAAGIVGRRDRLGLRRAGVVRAGQVRRTADRLGQALVDHLERHFRRFAGRDLRLVVRQLLLVVGDRRFEAARQVAAHAPLELGADVGFGARQPLFPLLALFRGAQSGQAPVVEDFRRDHERRRCPAERLAGCRDFLGA